MSRLRGKVAIVTGGGRRIGRANAPKEGAAVVVNDLGGEFSGEGCQHRAGGDHGLLHGRSATLRTAAEMPSRIGAGASFHGADLVTDKPDSPHLLVPKIKAHYLFAIAENDDQQDPSARDVLRESFAKVKLPAEIEVYAGAMHGWCPPGSPVYNEAQAEKAWIRMLALFKSALVPTTA